MRTKVTYLIMLVCLLVLTISTNTYAWEQLPKAPTGMMPDFKADSESYVKYQSGGTRKAAKYIDIVVSFSTCLAIYSAYPV